MAINLKKDEKINLSKAKPGLNKIRVGLGWTVKPPTNVKMDLDVSVFGLNAQQKLFKEEYFVFYGNKNTPDGAIKHLGDNRDGAGDGDDETILIDLSKVDPSVVDLSFTVTIYDENNQGLNFSRVTDSYIRILNDESGDELARYKLDENFTQESALQFGSLFRNGASWEFKAIGAGFIGVGLQDFLNQYN